MPSVRRYPDAEHLSRTAADEVARLAADAIAARGRFTIALAGGSTPKRLYELLAQSPLRQRVDWTNVEVFWGDERAVPPDHPDSNYGMARKALLEPLAISATRMHRMRGEASDLDAAARDYAAEVARVFNVAADGPPPSLDLVLLGMGPDGHTASLFPHTAALGETRRWVVANYVPKFQSHRLTMTTALINRAGQVMFLVAGADKAPALAEVLEGPCDDERLPSQRIQPLSGALVWMIDAAAAAQLRRSLHEEN